MPNVKFNLSLEIDDKVYSHIVERELTDKEIKNNCPQRTFERLCAAAIRYMQEKDLEAKLKSISSQLTSLQ